MVTPTIEEREAQTVVGIETHFAGDETVFTEVWDEFEARWNEVEPLAASNEGFGVMTDMDAAAGEFDYLVGVATDDPDAAPDEFAVTDLADGTYAVFETTLGTYEADLAEATTEWLPASSYERRDHPEFELYGPDFAGDDPTAPFTYWIPVRDA